MAYEKSDTGPFSITPEWVLYADISDRAVRLYGVLARYADSDGTCWPSRTTLAEKMRCSPDSVDRAKAELRKIGALEWNARHGDDGGLTSNVYRLLRLPPREDAAGGTGEDAAGTRTSPNENQSLRALELLEPEGDRAREPYAEDFARVWENYPRKTARKKAEKAYIAQRRKGVSRSALIDAVDNYAAARAGQDSAFTMHGATFFGPDDRWRDFLEPATGVRLAVSNVPRGTSPDLDAMQARAARGPQTGSKYQTTAPWEAE